jgi:hypothetical protein
MALALTACASDATGANLPGGWETAERVEELRQAPCGGSALADNTPETFEATAAESGIAVAYDHAHFRCVQDVEAFVRRANGELDLLVQPIDMSPQAVAGCDCLYDIAMQVPAPRGDYKLKLFRRWDSLNQPNDPIAIGEADVSIE